MRFFIISLLFLGSLAKADTQCVQDMRSSFIAAGQDLDSSFHVSYIDCTKEGRKNLAEMRTANPEKFVEILHQMPVYKATLGIEIQNACDALNKIVTKNLTEIKKDPELASPHSSMNTLDYRIFTSISRCNIDGWPWDQANQFLQIIKNHIKK